jgi:hypothetical protein
VAFLASVTGTLAVNRRSSGRHKWRTPVLAAIAVILVICWLLGFFVLHVSSFLIHLLLLFAVISIIMSFVRGRSGA